MADIIRTWPANVDPKDVAAMFGHESRFSVYYFTIGRGKPKQSIDRLWFTYQGRIIGYFNVDKVLINDGNLPHIVSAIDDEYGWRLKPDYYYAICSDGCCRIQNRLFMSGFRGWRYFDFDTYRNSPESRVRL